MKGLYIAQESHASSHQSLLLFGSFYIILIMLFIIIKI